MSGKHYACALLLIVCCSSMLWAQAKVNSTLPWSVRMTESEMIRNPESWQLDFQPSLKWDYCHGLELQSMLDVYDRYGDAKIFRYALAYADTMVLADGSIRTYKLEDYNIDRVNSGKMLFRIYEQTKEPKYKQAIDLLRSQLDTHPRNGDGGFWHKKVYPHQMWLDGLYMGAPFYAEYAYRNSQPEDYADVIRQILLAAKHTYDPKTNLYRHATDVSRTERWADPQTGQSAHSWGRAMGWYSMAIVDALDFIPKHEAGRDSVLQIFTHLARQIARLQDQHTGLWYQVLDRSGNEGNYVESSCSTMFTYALYKGVRKGYLDASFLEVAEKGYSGILKHFISVDGNGVVTISSACAVAGLGGKNYRSGTYEYYLSEPVRDNDPKAVGPFILASLEKELITPPAPAKPTYKKEITVSRDGTGDHRTIQGAIESVRAYMDYSVTIHVKNGTYKEKIVIPAWVKNVTLIGESAEGVVITHDDHANINQMGTFRTYTMKIEGDNITLRNLTVQNDAEPLGQAVALHTEGDKLSFYNCRFLGNQDTVFTGKEGARLYFLGCYIDGTTDFIFGPATALFEKCTIHSKRNSYITAASTPESSAYGYVFKRCRLTADAHVKKVYLGRPWRPYAATVFMECELGGHITPVGWDNWRNPENEKTARYAEYKNTGLGASTAERAKWASQLTNAQAKQYTTAQIFTQTTTWLPSAD